MKLSTDAMDDGISPLFAILTAFSLTGWAWLGFDLARWLS